MPTLIKEAIIEIGFDDHTSFYDLTATDIKAVAGCKDAEEAIEYITSSCKFASISSTSEVTAFLTTTGLGGPGIWEDLLEILEDENEDE